MKYDEKSREQFEKLCGMQCTLEEIASYFDTTIDNIEKYCKRIYRTTFKEVFRTFSAQGRMSLRRYQFQLAEKNVNMAIWLGKQYLGQTDKVEQEISERIVFSQDVPQIEVKELEEENIDDGSVVYEQ